VLRTWRGWRLLQTGVLWYVQITVIVASIFLFYMSSEFWMLLLLNLKGRNRGWHDEIV